MTIKTKCEILRTIYVQNATANWVLFENGTALVCKAADETRILETAKALAADIGPHGGEGSEYGDFNPVRLRAFPGWLVTYCWDLSVFTIVLDTEIPTAVTQPTSTEVIQCELQSNSKELVGRLFAGVAGRAARNQDLVERKIVARSWTE